MNYDDKEEDDNSEDYSSEEEKEYDEERELLKDESEEESEEEKEKRELDTKAELIFGDVQNIINAERQPKGSDIAKIVIKHLKLKAAPKSIVEDILQKIKENDYVSEDDIKEILSKQVLPTSFALFLTKILDIGNKSSQSIDLSKMKDIIPSKPIIDVVSNDLVKEFVTNLQNKSVDQILINVLKTRGSIDFRHKISKIVKNYLKTKKIDEGDIKKIIKEYLYEYHGKFYGVGEIVTIGYDPYTAPKKKANKKKRGLNIQTFLEKHKKKIKSKSDIDFSNLKCFDRSHIDTNEYCDTETGKRRKIGDNGMPFNEKLLKTKFGPDFVIDQKNLIYGKKKNVEAHIKAWKEVQKEQDLEENIEDIEKSKGPQWETSIRFVEKVIPGIKFPTFGLKTEEKAVLVPEAYKKKITENILKYKGFDQYIVVKSSSGLKLQQYTPSSAKKDVIEIFDHDIFPKHIPKKYRPTLKSDQLSSKRKKGLYQSRECVSFVKNTRDKTVVGVAVEETKKLTKIISEKGNEIIIENDHILSFKIHNLPQNIKKSKNNIIINNTEYILLPQLKDPKYLGKYLTIIYREPRISSGKISKVNSTSPVTYRINPFGKSKEIIITEKDIIKRVGCPGKKYVPMKDETPEDYLIKAITPEVRNIVIKALFKHISLIIPDVFENYKESSELLKLRNSINWDIANRHLQKWDDYIGEEFRKWLSYTLYGSFEKKAPNFTTEALQIKRDMTNPKLITKGFLSKFGPDFFDHDGLYIYKKIEAEMSNPNSATVPTQMEIYMRMELSKIGIGNLSDWNGDKLAVLISSIVNKFFQEKRSQYEVSEIREELKRNWILNEVSKYNPSSSDRNKFDNEFIERLKEEYEKAKSEIKYEKKKKDEYLQKKKALQSLIPKPHSVIVESVGGKELSQKGVEIGNQIMLLEEALYSESSNSPLSSYLQKAITLMMFMDPDDSVGKHATFFKEKIINNKYFIPNLFQANYYNMFPELFVNPIIMNNEKSKKKVLRALSNEIVNHILNFIEIHIMKTQPQSRETKFQWNKYINTMTITIGEDKDGNLLKKTISVIEPCVNATRVINKPLRGVEDMLNYDCKENVQGKYDCIAKREPIPSEDLVICYDNKLKIFSCSSLNDILHALKDYEKGKEAINPSTMTHYPKSFLVRMKKRYQDLLDRFKGEERILKFEANLYETLFGEPGDFEPLTPKEKEILKEKAIVENITKITGKSIKSEKISTIKSPVKSLITEKKELIPNTVKELLKGKKKNQKVVVFFKPSYLNLTKIQKIYQPFVDEGKVKVIVIETKEDEEGRSIVTKLQKDMGLKGDVVWVSYTSKTSSPKVIYSKELKGKLTYGNLFMKLVK